jgi:hypothetical protein
MMDDMCVMRWEDVWMRVMRFVDDGWVDDVWMIEVGVMMRVEVSEGDVDESVCQICLLGCWVMERCVVRLGDQIWGLGLGDGEM